MLGGQTPKSISQLPGEEGKDTKGAFNGLGATTLALSCFAHCHQVPGPYLVKKGEDLAGQEEVRLCLAFHEYFSRKMVVSPEPVLPEGH